MCRDNAPDSHRIAPTGLAENTSMTVPSARFEGDLVFLDEADAALGPDTTTDSTSTLVWRILVVDDDEDVHTATTFALGNLHMQGRPLVFLHAMSAAEARTLLRQETEIAVILLDVVMEQDDAGLQLVRFIREDCRLSEVRIILRTGQPGYAPEMDAIRDYDINDYKTKSELTRIKLFTAVTAAIRSYQQICAIESSRRGLDLIVRASAHLMASPDLRRFGEGLMNYLVQLLGQPMDALLCQQESPAADETVYRIVTGSGKYIRQGGALRADAKAPQAVALPRMVQTAGLRRNQYGANYFSLFFATTACNFVLYADLTAPLTATQQQLLDVFSSSLAVGFENMRLVARLHDVAFYDPLCQLPNRARLIELLAETLAVKPHPDCTLALVDIDHFAETNDAFGHGFGDLLLLAVATRLQSSLGDRLVVARVGGDTFCLLGDGAQVNPQMITALFGTPFSIDGEAVPLSATVGLLRLAEYVGTGTDALKDADIALKRAKTKQRAGHFYFSRNMGVDIRERVRLMHALRSAFGQRKLTLVYQPQIDLTTRAVVGAEALLRWRDDSGSFIPPDLFIPIAENSGLIIELGAWVLQTACEELMRLRALGHRKMTMSVNVSQVQFRHPGFLEMLAQTLQKTGVPATHVELEITESMAMEDPAFLIKTLEQVKRTGVSIAIDDFGTGFSSLSYLQQLQIDRIKIDRAFVNEITGSTRGSSIAEMVIQLGRNLGLVVIAEGVEDERQAAILRDLGCPLAQGYLFAKPMPPDQLPDWLQRQYDA